MVQEGESVDDHLSPVQMKTNHFGYIDEQPTQPSPRSSTMIESEQPKISYTRSQLINVRTENDLPKPSIVETVKHNIEKVVVVKENADDICDEDAQAHQPANADEVSIESAPFCTSLDDSFVQVIAPKSNEANEQSDGENSAENIVHVSSPEVVGSEETIEVETEIAGDDESEFEVQIVDIPLLALLGDAGCNETIEVNTGIVEKDKIEPREVSLPEVVEVEKPIDKKIEFVAVQNRTRPHISREVPIDSPRLEAEIQKRLAIRRQLRLSATVADATPNDNEADASTPSDIRSEIRSKTQQIRMRLQQLAKKN